MEKLKTEDHMLEKIVTVRFSPIQYDVIQNAMQASDIPHFSQFARKSMLEMAASVLDPFGHTQSQKKKG